MAPICSPTPTACHWSPRNANLPVLTIVYNNALYGAVRPRHARHVSHNMAAEEDGRRLADLGRGPAFEHIVEAHRGHGERVEHPRNCRPRCSVRRPRWRAGRQALVNVICTI